MSIGSSAILVAAVMAVAPAPSAPAAGIDVSMPQIGSPVSPLSGLNVGRAAPRLAGMAQITASAPSVWLIEPLAATAPSDRSGPARGVDFRSETAEGNILRLMRIGTGHVAVQTQSGRQLYSHIAQSGVGNRAETHQSGTFQLAVALQDGQDNRAFIHQAGDYQTAFIRQVGTGNTATIRQ